MEAAACELEENDALDDVFDAENAADAAERLEAEKEAARRDEVLLAEKAADASERDDAAAEAD